MRKRLRSWRAPCLGGCLGWSSMKDGFLVKRNLEDLEVADMEDSRLGDGERRWGSVGSTGSTGSATRSGVGVCASGMVVVEERRDICQPMRTDLGN